MQDCPFFKNLNIFSLQKNIILLDIDGTLVGDDELELQEQIVEKVKVLASHNEVFLCSNSKDMDRDKKFQSILGVQSVSGFYKKPNRKIKDILLNRMKIKNDFSAVQIVVIGDKSIIDGRFADNIGAKFIKVKSLRSGQESFLVNLSYIIDDLYCKYCR